MPVPDQISIRASTSDDLAAVNALLEAAYPPLMAACYEAALLDRVLPLLTRANPALLASGTFYLAVTDDGRVVGCGGWTVEDPTGADPRPGLAHMRHFGTHPDWLRRGVGRAISERCVAEARAAGVRRLRCNASLNSVPFYQALGFKPLRQVQVLMTPGLEVTAVLMERDL